MGISICKTDPKRRCIIRMLLLPATMVCLLCICGSVSAQQEPMYSQYMFNMLHINPAYAGNRGSDNFTLLYRNQWIGISGAPKTASVSWDKRTDENNMGYGLELYNDQLGIERTSGFQAFYSYYIPFNDAYLTFGISAGLLNYRAAYSESQFLDLKDPVFMQNVNGWLPTAGFGMLYCTPQWYISFSVPALLKTKTSVANKFSQNGIGANNHYFLTGGYQFEVSKNIKLKPSAMLKAVTGSPLQFELSLNSWFIDMIGCGVSYRPGDAIVGIFQFQLTPCLRIGYSYDYTISDFGSYNRGTHEVMLRWTLPSKETTIDPD
jgi:type IX secretion system PorP/SprF family membrane protein